MNDDRFRFDYLTHDFYWLLCSEDPLPQAGEMVFNATLNFVCDVRLCRDDEVLLDALGCLDANV